VELGVPLGRDGGDVGLGAAVGGRDRRSDRAEQVVDGVETVAVPGDPESDSDPALLPDALGEPREQEDDGPGEAVHVDLVHPGGDDGARRLVGDDGDLSARLVEGGGLETREPQVDADVALPDGHQRLLLPMELSSPDPPADGTGVRTRRSSS
jgi:hypothetical protein